ncbi:MAG: hypothetical protein KOO63_09320 [Bacteroidales bacterium]|nr:hypothetical protein [Candidatus Latescibacterota bacterium]
MKRKGPEVPQTRLSFARLVVRVIAGYSVAKEYGRRRLIDPPAETDENEFAALCQLEAIYGPTYAVPPKGYVWTNNMHTTIGLPKKKANPKQRAGKKVQKARNKKK